MEKFCKIFYYCALGIFCAFVVYLTAVMFASPRQDALRRGFIPCTETLVNNLTFCEKGTLSCPLKYLWQDTKCNIKVVWHGMRDWCKGEQKTPWENYLFTPVAVAETDEDNPYMGNVHEDMVNMEEQHKFIEQKQRELEDAKIRSLQLNEKVLIADPDLVLPDPIVPPVMDEIQGVSADITDEAAINDMENLSADGDTNDKTEKKSPDNNTNVLNKVNKITKEKLQNGELKDE